MHYSTIYISNICYILNSIKNKIILFVILFKLSTNIQLTTTNVFCNSSNKLKNFCLIFVYFVLYNILYDCNINVLLKFDKKINDAL